MIGTSNLPYTDINAFPRIKDINSLNSLPDPGWPLGPDGRKRRRRLQIDAELSEQRSLNTPGLTIPDAKYPFYTQIM
jgi:hypothetical protein